MVSSSSRTFERADEEIVCRASASAAPSVTVGRPIAVEVDVAVPPGNSLGGHAGAEVAAPPAGALGGEHVLVAESPATIPDPHGVREQLARHLLGRAGEGLAAVDRDRRGSIQPVGSVFDAHVLDPCRCSREPG
jgi:hypothetical protein